MLVERRRGALPIEFLTRVGLVWAVVSVLMVAINISTIAAGYSSETDDVIRLVQVRDLLAGQSWFDVTQYRVDAAGGGVAMSSSRLVDLPLALLIAALTPMIGASSAEITALTVVPLFALAITMMLAARIAWRLMGDEEATLASLILAISIPVLLQLSPMRIADDGWQLVCALAAVNGLMARSARVGGWVIGGSLALWTSISIDGLALSAAIIAVLALRWIRDRNASRWLVSTMQALAVIGALLFVLTRGVDDLATYCDMVGPLHLAMFGWGALVLTLIARMEPMPRGVLCGGFIIAFGGAAALLVYQAPQCAAAPFAQPDPLLSAYWEMNAPEGLPIWQQSLGTALQYAVTPVIGLIAAMHLSARSGDWLRRFWGDYAIILAAALVIALFAARAGAVACVLAAPPLAWQLREWLRTIRTMKRPAPRIAAMAGVSCALLPALPVILLVNTIPAQATLQSAHQGQSLATERQGRPTCRASEITPELRALVKGEIYAPIGIGPETLLVSKHSVTAIDSHRGASAMRAAIQTAAAAPEHARRMLAARGTSYVLLCPALSEVQDYVRTSPEGFAAHLLNGGDVTWLEPVDLDHASGFKLWKITPE